MPTGVLTAKSASQGDCEVVPGIAVRIGDHGAPTPDVMVHRFGDFEGNICDDLTVAFEVLSGSTAKRDLGWKLAAYPRLASAQSYVVVVPDQVSVLAFHRKNDWREHTLRSLDDVLQLPELGIELAVRDIYADVLP